MRERFDSDTIADAGAPQARLGDIIRASPPADAVAATPSINLEALMVSSRSGDQVAYRRLLVLLTPHLRGVVRRVFAGIGTGDAGADAEDAVQETLLAIHQKLGTWRVDTAVLPWARAIARYKAIDMLRHHGKAGVQIPIDLVTEPIVAGDDTLDLGLDLRRAVAELPRSLRQSVQAVKIDGLSVSEASDRTGLSEGAIKTAVSRGMRALSIALGGQRRAPDVISEGTGRTATSAPLETNDTAGDMQSERTS
jgi:RNA polymerase sigma-70 factor (ECF subfamily)